MKKFIFLIILIFTVFICAAPELDNTLKEYHRQSVIKELSIRFFEAEQSRFNSHLSRKESPDWKKINQIGCMGSYQFTHGTLKMLGYGYITPDKFKRDPEIFPPELQDRVLMTLIKSNSAILKNYKCYVGTTINGTVITWSGLIAAAHLGGAGSVIKYLNTNGNYDASDMNGTSISDYIREFQGYNI